MAETAHGLTGAIARNLRAERTRRGWSLEQLAARSGVSKGILVQLEQERTNPTVTTLYRVAEGLGITVASLVEVVDDRPLRVLGQDDGSVVWSGAHGGVGRLMLGTTAPGYLELWQWTLEPGDRCDGTVDPPGTHELLAVDQGTLALTVDEETAAVGSGCTVRFASDRPHQYRNDDHQTVRFHMVITQPLPNRP